MLGSIDRKGNYCVRQGSVVGLVGNKITKINEFRGDTGRNKQVK